MEDFNVKRGTLIIHESIYYLEGSQTEEEDQSMLKHLHGH